MKLKYYLRGIGAGIIFAALIFSFVIIPEEKKLTDEEIRAKAKELGMIEPSMAPSVTLKLGSPTPVEATGSISSAPSASATPAEEISPAERLTPSGETTNTPEPTDTPTPTATPTNTPVPTDTPTPTATPTPTPTSTPTPTVTPTPTPAPTNTPTPTAAPVNTPTPVPTNVPEKVKEATLVIEAGMSSQTVAARLQALGIISNAREFDVYLTENRFDNKLMIGSFVLRSDMSYYQIAKAITNP